MNLLRPRVNDGSSKAPRVEIHQAWWGMVGLGSEGKEWSDEEKLKRIAEAGFTGVLADPEQMVDPEWMRLLEKYELVWGISLNPEYGDKMFPYMEEASKNGALYANVQPGHSFIAGSDAIEYLEYVMSESNRIHMPAFVETHRNRITQDLLRTVEYVKQIPELRLTTDFSHYILAGEMEEIREEAQECFNILLERCSSIHLRISNGQQIQVDVGDEANNHPKLLNFIEWWQKGKANWFKNAGPGDILPIVSELGPPTYALIRNVKSNQSKMLQEEITDRWQQSLKLKGIVEKYVK